MDAIYVMKEVIMLDSVIFIRRKKGVSLINMNLLRKVSKIIVNLQAIQGIKRKEKEDNLKLKRKVVFQEIH